MTTKSLRQRLSALAASMGLASVVRSQPDRASTFNDLPAFYGALAALNVRRRTWKLLFFVGLGVCTAVIVLQQRILMHRLFDKLNEPVLIVPGAPEFTRVRPGQIPDESVFIFAEHIASHLGNFTWRNIRYHFGKISQYLTPAMRGRFERDFEARAKDWIERRVDQSFAYEPVRTFAIENDERGALYRVVVAGTRSQYVEGKAFLEAREFLALAFRARGNLTPDKPFIFEIESIEWLTAAQMDAQKYSLPPPSSNKKD